MKVRADRWEGEDSTFCTELRRLTIHVEHDIAAMLWSDRTIS